ncbi:MAG: DUF998 domain-containing protein [Saprospiraceae bacterium]|nr:DUF998 domain-containing protein [Saprospiraceae bacterium]
MHNLQENKEHFGQDQLIPFLWLRRSIGLLGILFPFVMYFGSKYFGKCDCPLHSVSAYYHSPMQNVFVGILCVIAMFLFTYRGPKKEDSWAANFACIFCLGVAFLPTTPDNSQPDCIVCYQYHFGVLHKISAVSFFLCLSYFSLILFPKTHEDHIPTAEKLNRNIVYRVCGYVMLGCMASIAIIAILIYFKIISDIDSYVFWFECIALTFFGISWIVKGGWFLQDKPKI